MAPYEHAEAAGSPLNGVPSAGDIAAIEAVLDRHMRSGEWKKGLQEKPFAHLRTIHYSELGPLRADDPCAGAWEVYRSHVGQWLSSGQAGRFVMIKGNEVLGFRDTFPEAYAESERRFPGEPTLIYEVAERHPVIRSGYSRL